MPMTATGSQPVVALRGVTKTYREGSVEHRVLDAVDLELAAGSCVALLGPSGSGKSTLLNLVGGIDLPTAGEVEVVGALINHLSERDRTLHRRRHIGLVFQFFNLIPTLTVQENLLLPMQLKGTPDGEASGRAAQLLERVGLANRGASFPDRLSGGEQQRVAIARALAAQPRVILADEPTGNLDQDTGSAVMDLFGSMVREQGATLLIATHSRAVAGRADAMFTIVDAQLQGAPAVERSRAR